MYLIDAIFGVIKASTVEKLLSIASILFTNFIPPCYATPCYKRTCRETTNYRAQLVAYSNSNSFLPDTESSKEITLAFRYYLKVLA